MEQTIPTLDLDDYVYTFMGCYKDNVDKINQTAYYIYEINYLNKVTKETGKFGLYGSKSELGILRLAYYRHQFIKGEDYISSSFVHPKIIGWIYENKHKLETKLFKIGLQNWDEKTNKIYYMDQINETICNPEEGLVRSLFRKPNQYDKEFWDLLSILNTEFMTYEKSWYSTSNINSFMYKLFRIYVPNDSPVSSPLASSGPPSLLPPSIKLPHNADFYNDYYNPTKMNWDLFRTHFNQVEQDPNPYLKHLIRYYIDNFDEKSINSRTQILNMILQGYDFMINKMLKIVKGTVKLETYYKYDPTEDLTSNPELLSDNHYIFTIELEPKDVDNAPKLTRNYVLYVLGFKFNSQLYFQPIFLRDKEAILNKYGLYDLIYTAGIFLYKPFEYDEQCGITPSVLISYKGNKCYLFFSENNQNIFPSNNEEFNTPAKTIIESLGIGSEYKTENKNPSKVKYYRQYINY